MGSKGSGTTTQTQTYRPDPAVYSAGLEALQKAQAASNLPFQLPVAPVAGFSPFQNQAFNQVLAAQGMAQPYFQAGSELVGNSARPITGQEIGQYYNPMAGNITAQMQNIYGQQMNQTTGKLIRDAGGVGASRIGVGQANLANQQGLAAGQTYANLYQQALQAAQQNKGMQLNAGMGLAQMGPAAQAAYLQGTGALGQAGAQQQQLAQAMLNAPYQHELARIAFPYQQAQYLAGITGGLAPAMGGTTNAQTTRPTPSPLNQILGLGTAALGFGMGMPWLGMSGLGSAFGGVSQGSYGGSTGGLGGVYRDGGPVGYSNGGEVDEEAAPPFPGASLPRGRGLSPIPTFRLSMGAGRSGLLPGQAIEFAREQQQSDPLSDISRGLRLGQGLGRLVRQSPEPEEPEPFAEGGPALGRYGLPWFNSNSGYGAFPFFGNPWMGGGFNSMVPGGRSFPFQQMIGGEPAHRQQAMMTPPGSSPYAMPPEIQQQPGMATPFGVPVQQRPASDIVGRPDGGPLGVLEWQRPAVDVRPPIDRGPMPPEIRQQAGMMTPYGAPIQQQPPPATEPATGMMTPYGAPSPPLGVPDSRPSYGAPDGSPGMMLPQGAPNSIPRASGGGVPGYDNGGEIDYPEIDTGRPIEGPAPNLGMWPFNSGMADQYGVVTERSKSPPQEFGYAPPGHAVDPYATKTASPTSVARSPLIPRQVARISMSDIANAIPEAKIVESSRPGPFPPPSAQPQEEYGLLMEAASQKPQQPFPPPQSAAPSASLAAPPPPAVEQPQPAALPPSTAIEPPAFPQPGTGVADSKAPISPPVPPAPFGGKWRAAVNVSRESEAGREDRDRYTLPRSKMPYPDSTERDWGQKLARSPWMSLVKAGAAMASTVGPVGTAIASGLSAGAGHLDEQRKALRSEEQINQRAQQLFQQARQHLDQYERIKPYDAERLDQEWEKISQGRSVPATVTIDGKEYPGSFDPKTRQYYGPNGEVVTPERAAISSRSGAAGRQSVYDQKRSAWLALYPDDVKGALEYAGGRRSLNDTELRLKARALATQQAKSEINPPRDVNKYIEQTTEKIFRSVRNLESMKTYGDGSSQESAAEFPGEGNAVSGKWYIDPQTGRSRQWK